MFLGCFPIPAEPVEHTKEWGHNSEGSPGAVACRRSLRAKRPVERVTVGVFLRNNLTDQHERFR